MFNALLSLGLPWSVLSVVYGEVFPFDVPFYGFLPAAFRWLKATTRPNVPLFLVSLVQASSLFEQAAVDGALPPRPC